jgi:hypothetical protein
MDKLIDKLPDIIHAAAQSALGIVALVAIALALLAFFFFRTASEKARIQIFSMLFLGVLGFGASLVQNRASDDYPHPVSLNEPAHEVDFPTPNPPAIQTPRFPTGYGMQVCGCWGFNPPPISPEPRCASGQVRLNACQGICPTGGQQYAYVCQ